MIEVIDILSFISVLRICCADMRLEREAAHIAEPCFIALFDIDPVLFPSNNGMSQVPRKIKIDESFRGDVVVYVEIQFFKRRFTGM